MLTLTRPEGTEPRDFNLSRRALPGLFFAGYAAAAVSAKADPIHTDGEGLIDGVVQIPAGDLDIPAYIARPDVSGRRPTVLVVSEVFGIHEYIRDTMWRSPRTCSCATAIRPRWSISPRSETSSRPSPTPRR